MRTTLAPWIMLRKGRAIEGKVVIDGIAIPITESWVTCVISATRLKLAL